MKLSEVSIERPVLATVMSLLILIFGTISILRLSNRELPDVDPPIVTVSTVFPGAAPEVVETSVTQPLEDQLIAIEGIKHLTSNSSEQVSQITVEFELYRDVDAAANDVRDRVARARRDLPEEVNEPIVSKRQADSSPVLWIALSGRGWDQIKLTTLAETGIKDRLSKLPGVSDVIIGGERRYSMRVWIDNGRLVSHFLTISDVAEALRRGNVEVPSGRIEGAGREFSVRTLGELKTPEEFGDLVIAERNGYPIRLRDVAHVEVGSEDERKLVRFNAKSAIALGIIRQSKGNTLDVVDAVRAELDEIRRDLPVGVQIEAAYDSSIFIRRSIEDVTRTILEAVVLVVLVIYFFLRRVRATVIPVVAIPVSIIGTAGFLDFFGFSINTLTLMGMTLAIGLVVDDAIVVLENVSRWVDEGTPPHEAARRGMEEISFAVVAATASVIAVFLPLVFLSDTTGRLFREFGVTVAAAVGISGFVALTLSPMLCARVLRPSSEERGIKAVLAAAVEWLTSTYTRWLRPSVNRVGVVLAVGLAWFALGGLLFWTVDREFVPEADRGAIVAFTRAPEGATLSYTDRYQRQVEQAFLSFPEIHKVFSVIALGFGTPGAVNEGGMFTTLTAWEDRGRSQQEILEELRGKLWAVPGMFAFAFSPQPLGQSFFGADVSLVIQGPDVKKLATAAEEIVRRMQMIPGVVQPRTDLLLNKPELEVFVDRDRAADLGVGVREIATTLQVLLGGLDLSTFKLHGETYKVMVQLPNRDRAEPRSLSGLYVHGREGQLIPLASVVSVEESIGARSLPHFDRLRSATISASLSRGTPLGSVLGEVEELAKEVLPRGQGYRVTFSGASEQFFESGNALFFAYLLAVLIVYLVLAAQFESFLHPITVLVAVALSFTGALLTLHLVGHTLNLFSQIGLVMLVGLVTKNSILIVEFANQLRERGMGLVEATFEASRLRFRPILMTALSTIVGILPIALGLGAGGEARAPLGMAVAGGMFFSTVLTIFVVPATYIVFARATEAIFGRRAEAAVAPTGLERIP